jgi:hypothetical protein
MNVPEQIKADDIDLRSLVPSGELISLREEWLCEEPPYSHRWQFRIETMWQDCVASFSSACLALGGRVEKWGPQRTFYRARDSQDRWVVTLSDGSTDESSAVLVFVDLKMLPHSHVAEEATKFANQQEVLTALAALWRELSLPIIMTSFERSQDGAMRGYVQLSIDEVKWPDVQRWLEMNDFRPNRDDEWVRQESSYQLAVLRGSGKVWASLK